MLGHPLFLDFDADPPDPDWVVDGLFERGTITVIAADSGVGKSILCQSLYVALARGTRWLGRATKGRRSLVLDEENARRIVHTRLKAFGMTNADRGHVRYYSRIGVALIEPDWCRDFQETVDDFGPDLVVVDTATSAGGLVSLNDNSEVARLFSAALRPASENAAVVLLHHNKKPPDGKRGDPSYAMMGAGAFKNQADQMFALETVGALTVEEAAGGATVERYRLRLETPKSRDGRGPTEVVEIVSRREPDGRLAWMRCEGAFSRRASWRGDVLRLLGDAGGSMSLAGLAEEFGAGATSEAMTHGLASLADRVEVVGGVVRLRVAEPQQASAF